MELFNNLHSFQSFFERVANAYTNISSLILVIFILWSINFVAGLIHKTYSIGKAFGSFYRKYLHDKLVAIIERVYTLPSFIKRFAS